MNEYKKQILFLGDSITRHYYEYVKNKLEVYDINANIPYKWTSQHNKQMRFINRNLQNRKHTGPRLKVDIVHFNFGLHNIKLPHKGHNPNFKRALPEWFDNYENQLITQINRLRELGICNILFSNTTPNPKNAGMRNNEDVKILNEVASKVMDDKNIPYNDLYSHVRSVKDYPKLYKHPRRENNCHFNADGNKHLSNKIVDFVLENINEQSI